MLDRLSTSAKVTDPRDRGLGEVPRSSVVWWSCFPCADWLSSAGWLPSTDGVASLNFELREGNLDVR